MINWTKLEAVGRMMFILFGATFFGALVIPLAGNGELPATWAAWRTILAVAFSAAILAEVAWIRSHLAQVASLMGLTPAATIAGVAETTAKVVGMAALILSTSFLTACNANGTLTPNGQTVVNVSAVGLETLACITKTLATDMTAAPVNFVQIAFDLAANCGMDVEAIIAEFGATNPISVAAQADAPAIKARVDAYKSARAKSSP
jgi:hypothetical protein